MEGEGWESEEGKWGGVGGTREGGGLGGRGQELFSPPAEERVLGWRDVA